MIIIIIIIGMIITIITRKIKKESVHKAMSFRPGVFLSSVVRVACYRAIDAIFYTAQKGVRDCHVE